MRTSSPTVAQAAKSADPVLSLLRCYALRSTPIRRAILAVLLQSPFALSSMEIEQQLPTAADRVTLYRTLRTFEEKELIHRVIDHSETVRYAACAGTSAPANHVHFKCTACQHIYCLSQVAVPMVKLPKSYRVTRGEYLLSGVCAGCQSV